MNIRMSMKIGVWLVIAVVISAILVEVTNSVLFAWIGLFFSVWLFLVLYWLSLSILIDVPEDEALKQPLPETEEALMLDDFQPIHSYKSLISTHQSTPE